MKPALGVLCAWLLCGGTHLALGSPPLRNMLVRRLGDRRFAAVYTLVAAASFTLLAAIVAYVGGDGAPGWRFGRMPAAQGVLGGVALLGTALVAAGFMSYFQSPMAVLRRKSRSGSIEQGFKLRAPSGVERITRHPFFAGMSLLMGAHALMADTLAGVTFFMGFVVLSLAGMPLQDRKLREQHGNVYEAYMTETAAVPFASHRSFSGVSTWNWLQFLAPASVAGLLAALHPVWSIAHGAPFVMLLVAGGLYAGTRQRALPR